MTDLAALSSLDDPVRRRLYEVVRERTEPVGRDEAAAAAGVGRALAVYHLDKLVEAGLLTASYQRPPGRSGPGPGRSARSGHSGRFRATPGHEPAHGLGRGGGRRGPRRTERRAGRDAAR